MSDPIKAGRSKSLDGIRGLAILLVIFFHYGYFAPGWIGVQLFFTLSGYLITSILLQSRNRSAAEYFGTFYWHRALRILPVVYLLLLICTVVYVFSSQPSSLFPDWPWILSFAGNFARMREMDLGPPFVHLWSLAVEQQFYFIWPILIFFLPLKWFRNTVFAVLILTPLIRYLLFQYFLYVGNDAAFAGKAAYVLPFAQFDAFAAGAAIPLWSLDRLAKPAKWFSLSLALAAAGGFITLFSSYLAGRGVFLESFGYAMFLVQDYGYVWGYSLLNVLSMLGIICVLQQVAPTRVLAHKSLAGLGRISYGVYVYHLPMLLLGNYLLERLNIKNVGMIRPVYFLLWVAAVIAISNCSYRFFELPILKFKDYWSARSVVPEISG